MPRIDPTLPLTPSLLDRLIDARTGGARGQSGYTIEQMTAAVRRDLEDLLNTRQSHADVPPEYAEVLSSIVAYGLPDLTTLPALTPNERAEMATILETLLTRFEPRLRDVRATLLEDKDERQRTLRFRIEATLAVDPAPPVAFDTLLELSTGHYSVKRSEE